MKKRKIKEQLSIRLDIEIVDKIIEIVDTEKVSINKVISDIVETYFKDKK